MKVSIRSIHNQGDSKEEYVILDVIEDCKLQFYMLQDTTYTDSGKISSKLRHSYWMPSYDAKKGDEIFLRTCVGENRVPVREKGGNRFTFYWGLDSAVWNDEGDCAVLFEIKAWKSKYA
ncbi:TPA: hypothetical protein U2Q62_004636 [Citrobacter amalonaticus]|uniref:hypothetical protein n=1 Tax=Citrobacter TaxID=544 RepID=UPI00190881CB|nr:MULTISPECIES: hypothetical protein [Citrobacter]MBJ9020967.1 hypothetical protein [Citrobacter farmeri]MDS4039529.1 hypothetical protein [Citrobacter amalonaticus]HED3078339.1 hypothetical protein [Citrobacter amalonaticus]HED3671535.1 hypothetical protein [Citrobacter amalonaticus]HED3697768.1 hypothetical protein [Citrobacter amalonaticus]